MTKSITKIAKRTPKKINSPLDDDTLDASLSDANCAFAFSSIGLSEIEDLKDVSAGEIVSFLLTSTSFPWLMSDVSSDLDSTTEALGVNSLV